MSNKLFTKFNSSARYILIASILLGILVSCTSRYKTNQTLIIESSSSKIRITDAFYVENLDISSPFNADFIIPGDNSIAVLAFFVRDTARIEGNTGIFGGDSRINFRMFVPVARDTLGLYHSLPYRSFVRNVSQYSVDESERTFLYSSGRLTIDSSESRKLYATLSATFRKQSGDSLQLQGEFKFKRQKTIKFSDKRHKID